MEFRMKILLPLTLLVSFSAASCPGNWPCKGSGWGATVIAAQQYNHGIYFVGENEDTLYSIRGYMQANSNLNSLISSAYSHWDKVHFTTNNASAYYNFLSAFVPKMEGLMGNMNDTSTILIDETMYQNIQTILNEHNHITDPNFNLMRSNFEDVVETLRGENYERVRAYINNEW